MWLSLDELVESGEEKQESKAKDPSMSSAGSGRLENDGLKQVGSQVTQ